MENIEQEHQKLRKALEFIMPVIMDDKEFQRKAYEKRKEKLIMSRELAAKQATQTDPTNASYW